MNPMERLFKEDLPAAFSSGKWRLSLVQLNTQLSQLEKQKKAIVADLGAKAWQYKVSHGRYSELFGKLEEIEGGANQVQVEINQLQNQINQETANLNAMSGDYDRRIKAAQAERQAAFQNLSQLQAVQKSKEQHYYQLQAVINQGNSSLQQLQAQLSSVQSSAQTDREAKIISLQSTIGTVQAQVGDALLRINPVRAELDAGLAAQAPVKSQVDQLDRQIAGLLEESKAKLGAIQTQLKGLQQNLLQLNDRKNRLVGQIREQLPELGNQVNQTRPAADVLSPVYAKVDELGTQIKTVADQKNLIQARLMNTNNQAIRRVGIAGGALVILLVGLVVLVFVAQLAIPKIMPLLAGGAAAEPSEVDIKRTWDWEKSSLNPNGQEVYSIVQVWENKRSDYNASSVRFEVTLYGSDNKVLKTDDQVKFLAAKGSTVIGFSVTNDTGSKVSKVSVAVANAEWSEYSGKFDQNKVSISKPFVAVDNFSPEIQVQVTNNSDFALNVLDPEFLLLTPENEPIAIFSASSGKEIAYGKTDVVGASFLFPGWVNPYITKDIPKTVNVRYWVTYAVKTGDIVSRNGENTLDLTKLEATPATK